ncbi:hypothetical protein [Duganella radicis]|uniref:Uncharacterized protein n=1 Tax=Duganella radicis TaxID=551988 RepID=A0A6L6PPD6_9BURK|nr:hypothetical protein [Duganella radicis]MTV40025.1 hypothetical protein [Duganella radicis]
MADCPGKERAKNDEDHPGRKDAYQRAFIGPPRIEDYNFAYDKKAGWQIDSIFYGGNDFGRVQFS